MVWPGRCRSKEIANSRRFSLDTIPDGDFLDSTIMLTNTGSCIWRRRTKRGKAKVAHVALSVSVSELDESESPYHVDRSTDGQVAPRKIDTPFLKHPAFRTLALDERLTTLLADFPGGQRPLLKGDQILMKPPHFGSAKPYHQDNFYFRILPADHLITAWIALDDVDEANGCLRYIEGSHKNTLLSHEPLAGEPYNLVPNPDLIDFKKEALAPVGKGGVVFHHSRTLHSSYRNGSDRWRGGYASHWVTDWGNV